MIAFWAAAGIFSAAAAIIVLLRAAQAATLAETADSTPMLYRRQIAEIGELAERGLIGEGERKSAEAEAGRRLLQATDAPAEAWSNAMGPRAPLFVIVVATPVLALILYLFVGAPGMGDQPFAARLKQWNASDPRSLTAPEIAAVLAGKIRTRPDDPEGYRLLAMVDGASGDTTGAVRALKHAVKLAPGRPDLWEMLGEGLIAQSGGDVTDDARDALNHTLRLDPGSVAARFHLARARIIAGDKAGGLGAWRALLVELPPDDPRRPALLQAISEAEGAPAPAAAPAQPSFSSEQMTAIKGMVAGLAAKLKADPSNGAGWVQLVKAYSVLGDTAARDAALKEARARFASRPDILDDLNHASATRPMP